jgi:hypothetical protein
MAQTAPVLPVDFESTTTNYTFTNFDGGSTTKITNPQSNGINTSANVAQMVKSAGQPWGGSWIQLAGPIDFSVNKTFKLKVYSPRVGAKVLLKVENETNGGINFEKEVLTTVANAWEDLTFDYSTISTTNLYHKIVFIFDLGTMGDGTANFTWLFDDVRLINSGGPALTLPVLPMDFESGTINYTFTNFNGGSTTKIANPQNNGINTSSNVAQMVKNIGDPWGGSWIQLAAPIDFSVNKTFKVKVYSPRVGAKLLLKVENESNPGINFEKEVLTTVANTWEDLTFDYSTISTTNLFHKIVFIFDLGTVGDGTANFTWLFDDVRLINAGPPALTLPVLPIDFESTTTNYTFTNFDGGNTTRIANPQINGINTSANVAQMVKNAGQPWGGSWIQLAGPIDFSVKKSFKVKVFSPRVGAKALLKVENATDFNINFEKEVLTTVANAWEELTFDYSTISTTNLYHKIIFIFDNGTVGDGTANFTWLIDDIKLVFGAPMVGAPVPTLTSPNVYSLYSDTYTPTNGLPITINWNPGWGQSTTVNDVMITGNTTRKYDNMNYQGVEFSTPLDVSAYDKLHLDIWTPNCTSFKVFLITLSPFSEQGVTLTPTLNGWNSFDIDLSLFRATTVVNLASIGQMKFEALVPNGSSVVYMDNLFFFKNIGLPITLTNFKATSYKNLVNLNWTTQFESNNKGFSLEKSTDGTNFNAITFVNGKGNSNTINNYQSIDNTPSIGNNYYRLKQIDFDGRFSYSPIELVKITKQNITGFSFYPNPVVNQLNVNVGMVENNNAQIQLLNAQGQIILKQRVQKLTTNKVVSFDVNGLSIGTYYIQLIDGSNTSIEKVVLSKN